MKELLFSITKKDFEVTAIRGSGPGGQHRNKSYTGQRIVHKASGAIGEATDSRSQDQNKKAAFRRLVDSPTFQAWYRIEVARRLAGQDEYKVEYRINGKWVTQ